MISNLLQSSILAVVFVAVLLAIPIIAFWRQMELGQRVYSIGFTLLTSLFVVIVPFRNPVTQQIHWSFAWSPPRYVDESLETIITPKLVDEIKRSGINVAPDFIENSTTKPMRQLFGRRRHLFAVVAAGAAGWFFVPMIIDRVAFGWFRPNARRSEV